jgi:hypothetical protein
VFRVTNSAPRTVVLYQDFGGENAFEIVMLYFQNKTPSPGYGPLCQEWRENSYLFSSVLQSTNELCSV